jgi:hypothetical protein
MAALAWITVGFCAGSLAVWAWLAWYLRDSFRSFL